MRENRPSTCEAVVFNAPSSQKAPPLTVLRNPSIMSLENFFTFLKQTAVEVKSRIKGRKEKSSRRQSSAVVEEQCRKFSLAELQSATKNFDHQLKVGEGCYGSAYKGFLNCGKSVIIKRFSRSMSLRTGNEFQIEIQSLCQLRHQNITPLIGFCNEREERILVYEYMNTSLLANRLHPSSADPLLWKQRLQVCIGAANGLHYLHTGAKNAIIHCNVRSASILLNENLVAQIGDFGLSKIGPHSMSKPKPKIKKKEKKIKGTVGYIAPEYMKKGELTEKCDVFSFGVVLFEVLCGRLASEHVIAEKTSMVSWICKCIEDGNIHRMIDPYLEGKIAPVSLIEFVEIAFSCIHPKPGKRPSMGEVEVTLELALELQEKADSVMKAANPHGHYTYEQAQFHASVKDYDEYLDDPDRRLG